MSRDKLKELQLIDDPTLAVFVRVSDLQKLYEFYNIDPYWTG